MHLYHAIFVVMAVMQTVSTLSYNFFISRNLPDNCCYNPRDKLSRDWGVYYPTTPPPPPGSFGPVCLYQNCS